MRKILTWTLILVMMLLFVGCGVSLPAIGKEGNETPNETPGKNGNGTVTNTSSPSDKGDEPVLPDTYPREVLPLAVDAELLDVRENPANKGLEVIYVSDNHIDTLSDFYEGALKDAQDLNTEETSDGYMITAKVDGVDYTIMLSKTAMDPNPKYAGKVSVYLILTGLDGISEGLQKPDGEGEEWPSADLPGVPQLNGIITQILREDGIIRLEITVEDHETVKNYISELSSEGFTFDTEPDLESDHMEFLAFKDDSMMSFAFKGEENLVTIELQK